MKKTNLLLLGLVATGLAAHAQTKTENPPPPPKPPKVVVKKFTPPRVVKDTEMDNFYKKNPEVTRISWENTNQVTVIRTDKTKERYNFTEPKEKKVFIDKYGELPPPPPPPPPPPSAPKEVQ